MFNSLIPEDQDSFECSIIEIQNEQIKSQNPAGKFLYFAPRKYIYYDCKAQIWGPGKLWLVWWLAFRDLCFKCFVSYATWHTICALVLLFAEQNSRPFWPQTPVLWEKQVVKTLNLWGSRIQVCVFPKSLWFNPWSMHGTPTPKQAWQFLHFSRSDCGSLEFCRCKVKPHGGFYPKSRAFMTNETPPPVSICLFFFFFFFLFFHFFPLTHPVDICFTRSI
jgi:hypothetical protein